MKKAIILGVFSLFFASCSSDKTQKEVFQYNPGFEKQWFERHKDESGKIPEKLLQKWYAHDIASFKNASTRGVSPITATQQLAPDVPQGGRTRAILIDVRDSTRFFAGGTSGGLWRSTNSGQSWSVINDAASSLSVTCITQNPLKPAEIYYGTGEVRGLGDAGASSGIQALLGNGVFKSKDGGLTFNSLKSTEGVNDMTRCNYMAHSLTSDSTVFLGTINGLYRSTNAGDTWTKVLNGFNTGIITFADGHVIAGVQNDGIYYSDNGATFTRLSGFGFPSGFGHVLLANCKTQPSKVYAWFSNPGQSANSGLFRSEDGGKTWSKKLDAVPISPGIGETQGGYNQMLGVNPTKPDWVVLGAQLTVMSKDGGVTWERYNSGHPDNHSYTPIGISDDFINASDGGVYKINWNNTATVFNLNKGYTTFQFYGGNYGATGTTAISGSQDNGSWRYVNNGVAAEIQSAFIPSGGTVRADGAYAHISQQNPDLAYMSIQFGQVFRSSNFTSPGGGTFEKINLPDVTEGIEFINLFEMNYADGRQLFYRTNKALWRTLNSGKDWERMNLTDISNIHAIGISPDADPTVYIGGVQNFYRIDKAASFIPPDDFVNLRNNIPLNYRTDAWGNISFHPKDKTTLLVGLTSMVSRSRVIKILKANSSAPEWMEIGGDLPERLPVYQVQAHPDDPDNVLFAATAFGLYYTLNGGKNWVKETRVPNVPIYELKLRASDKTLFLFTYGRGVFYLTLNTLTSTQEILPETAVKIYPNPASVVLNIEAKYPLSLIQVFSMDGKEVLTERRNLNIPIGHLTAGMYFVKVFDENGRFALKKFVKN